jgi:hypothetical protein
MSLESGPLCSPAWKPFSLTCPDTVIAHFFRCLLLLTVLVAAGCGSSPPRRPAASPPLASTAAVEPALAARILALDPDRVSDAQVQDVLRQGPTPRIMLFHGGVYPVHLAMTSFGRFLVGMGYPREKIRSPSGAWSYSPYEDVERLAGITAWYYEQEGMPPMLIGHSQGGMQAVKLLYVLAGAYGKEVPVWDPVANMALDRTTIRDPATGQQRPLVGLTLGYASVIGAGGAGFLLPHQFTMVDKLFKIPATVNDFTGYTIAFDLFAWTIPGAEARYVATGSHTQVRNVPLPAGVNHVTAPVTAEFAADRAARAWIDAYSPDGASGPMPPDAANNLLWAADAWWNIKKHWTLEAQQAVRSGQTAARTAANKE